MSNRGKAQDEQLTFELKMIKENGQLASLNEPDLDVDFGKLYHFQITAKANQVYAAEDGKRDSLQNLEVGLASREMDIVAWQPSERVPALSKLSFDKTGEAICRFTGLLVYKPVVTTCASIALTFFKDQRFVELRPEEAVGGMLPFKVKQQKQPSKNAVSKPR